MRKIIFTFFFFIHCTLIIEHCEAQWTLVGVVNGVGTSPSICVAGPNLVYVAGGTAGSPVLLRSTNGGTVWTTVSISGAATHALSCVWFNDINKGLIGEKNEGAIAKLYFTANGGLNWTFIAGALSWDGEMFSRINPLTGFAVGQLSGQLCGIYKTTNGGINWFTQNPPPAGPAVTNSVFMIDQFFYGFGISSIVSAKVVLTSDGGITWSNPSLPISGSNVSGISFKDDKLNGFSATSISLPNIAKTTDGGATWTSSSTAGGVTGYCNIKWIHGSDICYLSGVTGAAGTIKRTGNAGLSWAQMTTAGVTGITHFEYYKDPGSSLIYLYAVAGDGSVIKYIDNSLVGISKKENFPNEYKLYQNYPNPFNPITKIKFDIRPRLNPLLAKEGNAIAGVVLKVFDILGNEVATLVNEQIKPGTYEVEFDGTDYSSGVYFYRIAIHSDKLTAGSYIETKKMLMIK